MISALVQIILAFVYANFVEWAWHKGVFHGLGKNSKSRFSSHWREHHRDVRKQCGFDLNYKNAIGTPGGPTEEILGLTVGALLHLPLLFYFPVFVFAVWVHAIVYFLIHRKSHLDIEWAKKYVPWHYDHHMGRNQDANWCVTFPFWDYILGTREHFLKGRNK